MAVSITELRALLKKATPRPWRIDAGYPSVNVVGSDGQTICEIYTRTGSDRDVITKAVNALPALISAAEELERVREERDTALAAQRKAEEERAAVEAQCAAWRAAYDEVSEAAANTFPQHAVNWKLDDPRTLLVKAVRFGIGAKMLREATAGTALLERVRVMEEALQHYAARPDGVLARAALATKEEG